MLDIRVQGSVDEVVADLETLLGRLKGVAAAPAAEPAQPATRGRGKKATGTAQDEPTGAAAAPASGEITRDAIAPRCTAYAQKAGPVALQEIFKELGSENGKWSEVPDDKLGALDERLKGLGY